MPPRRLLPLVLSLGLLASGASVPSCGEFVPVLTIPGRDALWLWTGPAVLEVRRADARWRLLSTRGWRTLVAEGDDGGLFYERDGERHRVVAVTGAEAVRGGWRLDVATDEGLEGTLRLCFRSARTLEVDFEPPLPGSVEALGEALHSPPDEAIYGLTERLRDSPALSPGLLDIPADDAFPVEVGSLDRRGETVEMRILPTIAMYAPFYHSSRGYGLHVEGTTFGLFDLASSEPETVSFRFETGTTPASRRLVFDVFAGPDHPRILDEYTARVGRPFVPPDWAFQHWRWRGELDFGEPAEVDGVPINAEVADDVLRYEAFGIPAGVYVFDRPVFPGDFGLALWEWDEERLPNPPEMLDALRRRGWRLGLWSGTWVCGSAPGENGAEALRLGYVAPGRNPGRPPDCDDLPTTSFILDVTHAEARRWWQDRIRDFVARWGIQAIKLDRGEEHIASEATDVWADGRTGREVRNDYPILQARLHHDAMAEVYPDGDFVVMPRASYTGTPTWAVFWGGDTAGSEFFGIGMGTDLGLRSAIISQQRAAFMGAPIWGSDTGGYYPFKDRELFARWLQFSTFSGLMEIGGVGSRSPWDMPTEPAFDEEMIAIYRSYVRLRHALVPYIAAAARDARYGMPLVRPMPFEDREDPELRDRWDQYGFGPDLLVAPVWRIGERSRDVYLPRGRWREYWELEAVVEGPALVTVDAPLGRIPVWVRDGAAVPRPPEMPPR